MNWKQHRDMSRMGNTQAWLKPVEGGAYEENLRMAMEIEDEPIRLAMPIKSRAILGSIATLVEKKRLTRTEDICTLSCTPKDIAARFLVSMTRIGLVTAQTEQVQTYDADYLPTTGRGVLVRTHELGIIVQGFYLSEEGESVLDIKNRQYEQRLVKKTY